MKYVLIIPDGMADQPIKKLNGKTPLEVACTPHMDYFAGRGVVGLSQNTPEGFSPGTDIGCLSVFGYDPRKYFTGRGPLEAAVYGIKMKPKDLVFRCNLVTTQGNILKDFTADHISLREAKKLIGRLNRAVRKIVKSHVRFYAGKATGYRHLMIVKNAASVFDEIKCVPPHNILDQEYQQYLPGRDPLTPMRQKKTGELLNQLMNISRDVFKDHPVNRRRRENRNGEASQIWLWGQGFRPKFPSYEARFGFRGGVITAVDVLKGIALHAGLEVIRVPGVTGYFDTNYLGKAEHAIRSLRKNDFVAIHIESTDEAGHMGDIKLKIKAIEDVDRLVLGTLRTALEKFDDYKILLLPDHYTCVETRTHSSDPVPFFIYSSKEKKEGPRQFCEKSAKQSGFVMKEGHRLMDFFVRGQVSGT